MSTYRSLYHQRFKEHSEKDGLTKILNVTLSSHFSEVLKLVLGNLEVVEVTYPLFVSILGIHSFQLGVNYYYVGCI